MIYARRAGSDAWHWMRDCTAYPNTTSTLTRVVDLPEGHRPVTGELCNQCLAKERNAKKADT